MQLVHRRLLGAVGAHHVRFVVVRIEVGVDVMVLSGVRNDEADGVLVRVDGVGVGGGRVVTAANRCPTLEFYISKL